MAAGQVVEYRAPLAEWLPPAERQQWETIGRLAAVMSSSAVVPRPYRANPAAIFVVLWTAVRLGMAATIRSLVKFDVIEGVVEPRAQTLLGMAMHAGHHMRFTRSDELAAEMTTIRRGETVERFFSWRIEEAESAGLLDQTVERTVQLNRDEMMTERYVLGSSETPPEWATKLIDAGNVRRKETWYRYRADMLANCCAKLAQRGTAPDVEPLPRGRRERPRARRRRCTGPLVDPSLSIIAAGPDDADPGRPCE